MRQILYMLSVFATMVLFAGKADAQMGKRYYIDGGWQFNGAVANGFADGAQGYGAYLESGYYVTPKLAVGGFASFNTNNRYVPKQTYVFDGGEALTTDLYTSLYQVPFGAALRYRFARKVFQPYVEARVGAEYSSQSVYMSTFLNRESNLGLYVSPEVGFAVFPFRETDIGFQVAAYYSYATNRNASFGIDGLNNVGFKLGMAF